MNEIYWLQNIISQTIADVKDWPQWMKYVELDPKGAIVQREPKSEVTPKRTIPARVAISKKKTN